VRLTEYYWGCDDIEENEMGGPLSSTGRREMLTRFWGRNLEERYLGDLGIDGRIIEK